MANKVDAINGTTSTASNPSSINLTASTKAELENLGVNTLNIVTEAQGQLALKAAKQARAAQAKAIAQAQQFAAPEENLKREAKELALRLHLSVSSDDDISEILSKISIAINQLKAEASDNSEKSGRLEIYQAEYARINQSLTDLNMRQQAIQAQISGSMSGMASYNKIYQNL